MQPLQITLIQTEIAWEDPQANCKLIEEKITMKKLAGQVVVLPEMFTTGFTMNPQAVAEPMDGPTLRWMQQVASVNKIILCGSIVIQETSAEHSAKAPFYYNRLIWMLPNGHFATYDKRHLFAYAGEDLHYTSGNKRLIASANGWKIQLQICYDLRFPVWSRQAPSPEDRMKGEAEYDALIYVANWPEKRIQAWRSLLIARAIENQSYVIGVNRVGKDGNGLVYTGNSMFIDPMGEVLYERSGEEDMFTATLDPERLASVRERLPFLKDGDDFYLPY